MNSGTFGTYGFVLLILLFVYWRRSRRASTPRLIRAQGYLMLLPVLLVVLGLIASVASLSQTGQPLVYPPLWEELAAALIGVILGAVMLYHTGYERGSDGLVYTRPNPNFKYVLIAVIVLRLIMSQYLNGLVQSEFIILTMTLALLYIGVWRVGSFVKYRRTNSTLPSEKASDRQ